MFKTIIILMFQELKTYVEVKYRIITQMRQGWSIKLNYQKLFKLFLKWQNFKRSMNNLLPI